MKQVTITLELTDIEHDLLNRVGVAAGTFGDFVYRVLMDAVRRDSDEVQAALMADTERGGVVYTQWSTR